MIQSRHARGKTPASIVRLDVLLAIGLLLLVGGLVYRSSQIRSSIATRQQASSENSGSARASAPAGGRSNNEAADLSISKARILAQIDEWNAKVSIAWHITHGESNHLDHMQASAQGMSQSQHIVVGEALSQRSNAILPMADVSANPTVAVTACKCKDDAAPADSKWPMHAAKGLWQGRERERAARREVVSSVCTVLCTVLPMTVSLSQSPPLQTWPRRTQILRQRSSVARSTTR